MTLLTIAVLLALHVLAAMFWVGGMAFAYLVLRPAAGPLDPALRLPLWRRVFAKFLPWVGVSIVVLLISGYCMIFLAFDGFRTAPTYVHLMQGLGLIMMAIYLHLFFAPWRRFGTAVDQGVWPQAAQNLNQIRVLVAINLALGIITIAIGASGRYW